MSDIFNINQSQSNNPSTNLAKDNAKQQINVVSNSQHEIQQNFSNTASEIEALLVLLSQRHPKNSVADRQAIFRIELERKSQDDPSLRNRFLSAAKAGSIELIKALANNPFVSVPLETAKGWLEAEQNYK
jgi:hypothetical protein